MRVFARPSFDTLKILEEVTGHKLTENIEKSASATEESDVVKDVHESVVVKICGVEKHRASVLDYDTKLNSDAEKSFGEEALQFVKDKLASIGGKCRLYDFKVKEASVADVGKKGFYKAIPDVKSAKAVISVSGNSFGQDNVIDIEITKENSKIKNPDTIRLNESTTFEFSPEGWNETIKECFTEKYSNDEDVKSIIIWEQKEFPNIGMRGVYRSLGKFCNYIELNQILKSSGYLTVDKYKQADFGNSIEIIPTANVDFNRLITILDKYGVKFASQSVVSEGSNSTPTKNPAIKEVKVDGEKTQTLSGKDKDAPDGSRGDDVAYDSEGEKGTGNKELVSEGSNSEAKKEDATVEISTPGEKTQTRDDSNSVGSTDKNETDSATVEDFQGRSLSEGKKTPEVYKEKKIKGTDKPESDSATVEDFQKRKLANTDSMSPTKEFDETNQPGKRRANGICDKCKAVLGSDGVCPKCGMSKACNSARKAAIAEYVKKNPIKQADTFNVDIGVDDNRTRLKQIKSEILKFFKNFHYIDEAVDKFSTTELPINRGDIAKNVLNLLKDGYRAKVKTDGSEEELTDITNRNITSVIGKIKLVSASDETPENPNGVSDMTTKEAQMTSSPNPSSIDNLQATEKPGDIVENTFKTEDLARQKVAELQAKGIQATMKKTQDISNPFTVSYIAK